MTTTDVWVIPPWILEALELLRPAAKGGVREWADNRRILDGKTSSMPGPWRTSYTPYLAGIMDAFTEPEVEEISFVKPTQTGGTETLLNMIGYVIDEDPGAAMLTLPKEELGEHVSDNRLRPMMELCPTLRDKFDKNSKRLELQFDGMYLVITGANSPSSLASHPIRYLFMDEVDKYPVAAGKEADPRSLARERTKTYDSNKKIVNTSTPTFENGPIWTDWLRADSQYQYFVRCPHCGEWWTFEFAHLKFDNTSRDTARDTAVYCCKSCGGTVDDTQKNEMVRGGEWRAIRDGGRRKIAYHLNSFYSPWVRLGDIAYEFESSRREPEKLMNFINSWLAEPFKDVEVTLTGEWIHDNRASQYPEEMVPQGTVMITAGVDVQKDSFFWTIRAWRDNMTSYNLCHGQVFSWREIEHIMNRYYYDREKTQHIVNLCCVDSGDQTDDVYDFCAINAEWAVPIKGASTRLQGRYQRTIIDRANSKANGLTLYRLDTNHYKDTLFARLRRDEEDGGWYTFEGCDPEYCEMISSEHRVLRKYNGRLSSVWETKAVGRANHYLDCEVYAMLAADLCGIRDINVQRAQADRVPAPVNSTPMPHAAPTPGGWLEQKKRGWFG